MQNSFCNSHPKNYQIPQSNSPSPVFDGLRVLVVDDDANNLNFLEIIFKQYQAQVNTASSVDEAIEVIEEWKPDILISDISMPNKDGYSLIRSIRIKEAEVGGFLPAVAITGCVFPENRSLAFNAGFQMLIIKPFDSEELVAVVAKLLDEQLKSNQ
ncbi:histidine kinase [Scytonema hofmannii PCC 7110]|uniref:Histidine kinase n=1 Tax=Scytonema hofmannii PCC 7110 TaxID=128403 RepID=A0A139X160_9CYAN|nr:response regulator [Scytonema hofmannii]KYC38425.1 histidine kinase [Scytonema hofmannii PCC 7110]